MLNRKENRKESRERLDSVGRDIVRLSAANESEADAATQSPFLLARFLSVLFSVKHRFSPAFGQKLGSSEASINEDARAQSSVTLISSEGRADAVVRDALAPLL